MAIEPISSAMTYQAQPVASQMTAPVQPAAKPASEFTEAAAQNVTAPVDNVTLSVNSAGETDTDSGKQNQQDNANKSTGMAAESKRIKEAVEEMNKKIANSEAQFGIHEATNRVTIKIVDKQTKEVIKELPPEKTLDMIARIWDMAGLLVDEKR